MEHRANDDYIIHFMSNMLYAKDEYRALFALYGGRASIHCSYRPYTASERSERSPDLFT